MDRRRDTPDEIEALASRWSTDTLPPDEAAHDRRRVFRVAPTRTQVMMAGIVANATLLAFASQLGMVDAGVALRYVAAVALLLGAARVASRAGMDNVPLEWLAMVLPGMAAMYELGDTASRGAFLLLSLAPLGYEMVELTKRRFIAVAVGYAACYSGMLLLLREYHPERIDPSADKLMAVALVGVVVIVSGVRALMRETLLVTRRSSDELRLALSTMAHVAEHDALTEVVNRRFLTTLLDMLTQRAGRRGDVYSVALFDVDHFKSVNDRHGHVVGDRVLQRVAQTIAADVRASDAFGRWGGEEFLLVMPDTPLGPARAKAERLRCLIERVDWSGIAPDLRGVTISAGVAAWRDSNRTEDVVSRVDAALYAAKRLGRNRVEGVPGEP